MDDLLWRRQELARQKSASKRFVEGTLFLSLAVFFCKALGLFYIVPLQRMIGDFGVGLYNMAFPVYTIFLTLSTAGLPLAVSKFVAEFNARGDIGTSRRLFHRVSLILTASGWVAAVVLYLGAPVYVKLFASNEALVIPVVRALAPALLVFPVLASLRGYFQGWQRMQPTGNSQMLEQVGRVGTVLLAAFYLSRHHYPAEQIAAVCTGGAFIGGLLALAVLLRYYIRHRRELDASETRSRYTGSMFLLLRKVLVYAVPISLGALVVPLFNQVDVSTVEASLRAAGFSAYDAAAQFGVLSGRAMKLTAIPAAFASTIALTIIPLVSEAHALGDAEGVRRRAELGLRVTLLAVLPAATGLAVLAEPVNVLLFANGKGSDAIAILSVSTVFSTMESVSTGVLQGIGYSMLPVVHLFVGLTVKVALNLGLVPRWGITGSAWASVISYVVASQLNLWRLRQRAGLRISAVQIGLKPLAASLVMGAVLLLFRQVVLWFWLPSGFQDHPGATAVYVAASVIVGAVLYVILLLRMGLVSEQELQAYPWLGKWYAAAARRFPSLIRAR
jgi:PST family polysaccharide transporter